jgi:hypothetical protein
MQVERDRNPISRPKPTRPFPQQASEARNRNPPPRPSPQRPGFPLGEKLDLSAPEAPAADKNVPNIAALFR